MSAAADSWSINIPSPLSSFEYPEGAHCLINYRSLIHDVVAGWRAEEKSDFDFKSLFAATDSVLDAQHALFAAENRVWPKDSSERSLWLYGSLQALVIERHGTFQVLRCFDLDPTEFMKETQEMNEIRIRVAGHPSDHRRKNVQVKGVSFVGRHVRDGGKFNIGTYPDGASFLGTDVDVVALIRRQSLAVNKALSKVWLIVRSDWRTL